MSKLPLSFFRRKDVVEISRELLGHYLLQGFLFGKKSKKIILVVNYLTLIKRLAAYGILMKIKRLVLQYGIQ